ncbi:helix-turn-helix domain-containing protein [SAR202 cluster bacterium AD-812-D07_MRT_10900m]|nr:helix-turn-helix domain-containing protein [SAR202 cluster bacterium AD-812-D07_MRT_10900m]
MLPRLNSGHQRRSRLLEVQKSQAHEVLTVGEAARLLRVSEKTLYRLISAGSFPVLRFGRAIRIPRAVIETMLTPE